MVYIIHGATGAQGTPVRAELAARGERAVAAVRGITAVAPGTDAIAVDLADAAGLEAAYTGADGVFVHLPMGATGAAEQAAAIVAAVEKARPGRVVISTSGQIVDEPDSPLLAPAGSPIQTLIRGVVAAGVSTAVVAPRLYLENLLLPIVAGPAHGEGVLRYPLPADFRVSWSSHRDVAVVAAHLLVDAAVTGTVSVGHEPGLVGDDLATAFAAHWDRPVRFESITSESFGARRGVLRRQGFSSSARPCGHPGGQESNRKASDNMSVRDVDAATLQPILRAEEPVLIQFWAEWCAPCRAMIPVVERFAEENAGIAVVRVDIDAHPDLASEYRVTAVPMFTLMKNEAVQGSLTGAMPPTVFAAKVEKVLSA